MQTIGILSKDATRALVRLAEKMLPQQLPMCLLLEKVFSNEAMKLSILAEHLRRHILTRQTGNHFFQSILNKFHRCTNTINSPGLPWTTSASTQHRLDSNRAADSWGKSPHQTQDAFTDQLPHSRPGSTMKGQGENPTAQKDKWQLLQPQGNH